MTQSDDLKTVVRNWITSRIYATNDVYLPSNDYIKFDKTEEHNSGVYSTVLKDSDKTGKIEFIDVLDKDETEPDKEVKVVGMNMFNDAIEQLQEQVAQTNFLSSEVATKIVADKLTLEQNDVQENIIHAIANRSLTDDTDDKTEFMFNGTITKDVYNIDKFDGNFMYNDWWEHLNGFRGPAFDEYHNKTIFLARDGATGGAYGGIILDHNNNDSVSFIPRQIEHNGESYYMRCMNVQYLKSKRMLVACTNTNYYGILFYTSSDGGSTWNIIKNTDLNDGAGDASISIVIQMCFNENASSDEICGIASVYTNGLLKFLYTKDAVNWYVKTHADYTITGYPNCAYGYLSGLGESVYVIVSDNAIFEVNPKTLNVIRKKSTSLTIADTPLHIVNGYLYYIWYDANNYRTLHRTNDLTNTTLVMNISTNTSTRGITTFIPYGDWLVGPSFRYNTITGDMFRFAGSNNYYQCGFDGNGRFWMCGDKTILNYCDSNAWNTEILNNPVYKSVLNLNITDEHIINTEIINNVYVVQCFNDKNANIIDLSGNIVHEFVDMYQFAAFSKTTQRLFLFNSNEDFGHLFKVEMSPFSITVIDDFSVGTVVDDMKCGFVNNYEHLFIVLNDEGYVLDFDMRREMFDIHLCADYDLPAVMDKICIQNDSLYGASSEQSRIYNIITNDEYTLNNLNKVVDFTYYGGTFYILSTKQLYMTKDFTKFSKALDTISAHDKNLCFNPTTMSIYTSGYNEPPLVSGPKRHYMNITTTTQNIKCSGTYGINHIESDELSSHGNLTIKTNTDINAFTIWLTNPSIFVNNTLTGTISTNELIDKDKIILRNDIDSISVPQYSKIESIEQAIASLQSKLLPVPCFLETYPSGSGSVILIYTNNFVPDYVYITFKDGRNGGSEFWCILVDVQKKQILFNSSTQSLAVSDDEYGIIITGFPIESFDDDSSRINIGSFIAYKLT